MVSATALRSTTGADQIQYNGFVTITVLDANTFCYTVSTAAATPATFTNAGNGVAARCRSSRRSRSPEADASIPGSTNTYGLLVAAGRGGIFASPCFSCHLADPLRQARPLVQSQRRAAQCSGCRPGLLPGAGGEMSHGDRRAGGRHPRAEADHDRRAECGGNRGQSGQGLVHDRGGQHGLFTMPLGSMPKYPVTIGLSSTDLTEGTVSVPSVVFDNTNWNILQTVTISGVDDLIADGNVVYKKSGDRANGATLTRRTAAWMRSTCRWSTWTTTWPASLSLRPRL